MKYSIKLLAASAVFGLASVASAAPTPTDPAMQSPQALYLDAKETQAMMAKDPSVVLVDVRTPEEWQFVGYTTEAKIMLPWMMFDYSKMETQHKQPHYRSAPNPKWMEQFKAKASTLGMNENTTYIIMCRSGATRAAPVAKLMDTQGYKNVYVMTDGFEGDKNKDGELKGFRAHNGWKNSGAAWTDKIDADKVYFKAYGVTY